MSFVSSYERKVHHRAIRGVFQAVKNYVEVTKPLSVFLLVFTALGAMIVAAEGQGVPLSLLLIAALVFITAGCAGANVITCYIDRDT